MKKPIVAQWEGPIRLGDEHAQSFHDTPGLYLFLRGDVRRQPVALYAGKASNLFERMLQHAHYHLGLWYAHGLEMQKGENGPQPKHQYDLPTKKAKALEEKWARFRDPREVKSLLRTSLKETLSLRFYIWTISEGDIGAMEKRLIGSLRNHVNWYWGGPKRRYMANAPLGAGKGSLVLENASLPGNSICKITHQFSRSTESLLREALRCRRSQKTCGPGK